MCESQNPKKPYVSLIKINGKPILPPVITPGLRKELLQYKQQAIKLEKRLKTCRELKKHLEELHNSCDRPCSDLTFGDISHIEALNISDKPKSPRKLKNIHLSKDLIEVTQYNCVDSKVLCSNEKTLSSTENIISDCIRPRSSSESRQDNITKQTTCASPKPRLIRSNSYTLDAPSPILLEHLKRSACKEPNVTSIDKWVLPEPDSTHNSEDFSTMNTVILNQDSPDKSSKDIEKVKSPTGVFEEISVQEIVSEVNKVDENDTFFTKKNFWHFAPPYLENVLKDIPDVYAKQILEMLKKQDLEEKEMSGKSEEETKANKESEVIGCMSKSWNNATSSLMTKGDEVNVSKTTSILPSCPPNSASNHLEDLIDLSSLSDCSISCDLEMPTKPEMRPSTLETNKESQKLTRSSTFSMSPSQSIYYSISSDSDTVRGLTPALHLTVEVQEELEIGILREKDEYWEAVVSHEPNNVSCSRELFPDIDPVTMQVLKRDWAASVIGAHVRGYLTRRLIKTEKVQTLIATVKDVLVCALELHHSKTIDEKDVELHRRLINQLSAALYSFHDIFFELPIAEQMSIIRADRQRRREKLKKPQSGRKSAKKSLNSSRSDKSVISSIESSRSSSKIGGIKESPKVAKV